MVTALGDFRGVGRARANVAGSAGLLAAQLGHTDGGVLVQRLYGHPSTDLARKRAHEAHRRPIVLPLRPGEELGEG